MLAALLDKRHKLDTAQALRSSHLCNKEVTKKWLHESRGRQASADCAGRGKPSGSGPSQARGPEASLLLSGASSSPNEELDQDSCVFEFHGPIKHQNT